MTAKHIVFVYGTLKRGYPNAHVGMPRATWICNARTVGCYPLVIGGKWFTPNLLNEAGHGFQVTGEVYEVDDAVLAELDELESVHLPNGYRRLEIAIEPLNGTDTPKGPNSAWTYLRERQHVGDIHAGPMETYPLDAGYVSVAKRG